MTSRRYPDFVACSVYGDGGGTLRHGGGGWYVKDNGAWGVSARYRRNKLVITEVPNPCMNPFLGVELVKCPYVQYAEDTGTYALSKESAKRALKIYALRKKQHELMDQDANEEPPF